MNGNLGDRERQAMQAKYSMYMDVDDDPYHKELYRWMIEALQKDAEGKRIPDPPSPKVAKAKKSSIRKSTKKKRKVPVWVFIKMRRKKH